MFDSNVNQWLMHNASDVWSEGPSIKSSKAGEFRISNSSPNLVFLIFMTPFCWFLLLVFTKSCLITLISAERFSIDFFN